MTNRADFSRRSFLAFAAASPLLTAAAKGKSVPVGLELFSVRNELAKDPMGTVKAVAKMGYQGVEFFSPYYGWTPEQAKDMRKLLDDLNIKCFSTHNGPNSFDPANTQKTIDLNSTIGSKYVVMASAGRVEGLDGWKGVAEKLNAGNEAFGKAGIHSGYHNHQAEFKPIDGKRPIEVIAANTVKDVMLQLDIGTCIEAGSDPVAWINQNPGRIRSCHLKEWSSEPGKGYHVLFGQGNADWKKIFAAAESKGGVEYYLIEQEGAEVPPFEAAEKCLQAYRATRNIKTT
jgi:sugar phosphate isomerase/epimerase